MVCVMSIRASDVMKLPIPERIQLVAEIWDSIADTPDQIETTPETIELLRHRLAEYRQNPTASSPWPEVKERILNSLKK